MRLVLFGQAASWNHTLERLQQYNAADSVVGLSDVCLGEYTDSDVTYSLSELLEMYNKGEIDGVLQTEPENTYYTNILKQIGIPDIYIIPENIKENECIKRYSDIGPVLNQIEFHLTDHCNLNCRVCAHFSNLVSSPVYADYEQFNKDIHKLSEYFSQIKTIYLLGGEPLLNKDIGSFIISARDAFPYACITVVTNGILLLSISDDLIQIIKDNNVLISISDYECLDNNKIITFIKEHELNAELRLEKESFAKHINIHGDSDKKVIFNQCMRRNCTFLSRGMMAACCTPFLNKYFNERYNEKLPEMDKNDCIDIYEPGLDGWKIKDRLIQPMESCRYCGEDAAFKWGISQEPILKSDWCL